MPKRSGNEDRPGRPPQSRHGRKGPFAGREAVFVQWGESDDSVSLCQRHRGSSSIKQIDRDLSCRFTKADVYTLSRSFHYFDGYVLELTAAVVKIIMISEIGLTGEEFWFSPQGDVGGSLITYRGRDGI